MRGLKTNKLLVVDLEACCWEKVNPDGSIDQRPPQGHSNDIIEIGYALIDLTNREIIENDTLLVNPKSEISDFCVGLTTITQELLDQEGVTFQRAIKLLNRKGFKNIPWASWGKYDYTKMVSECEKYDVKMPFHNHEHYNLKTLFGMYNGSKKGMGQKRACNHMEIDMDGTHHRGVDDARNAAKVFLSMLADKK